MSRYAVGDRIETLIDDMDTDTGGDERLIPAGTLGTIFRIDGPEQHHVEWANGGWTIWSEEELDRDARRME